MEWEERHNLPQRQRRDERRRPTSSPAFTDAAVSNDAVEGPVAVYATVPGEGEKRPELRSSAIKGTSYEYLDHTADVQLHAWGGTLNVAFSNTALAMFNYMTPLEAIRIDDSCCRTVTAEGHDMHSLLFSFLDELLFLFSTELMVFKEVEVIILDTTCWHIEALGRGEKFDRQRHDSGTEIKAITFSAMEVNERTEHGDCEIFVIVDI